jgi:hypothetical protein
MLVSLATVLCITTVRRCGMRCSAWLSPQGVSPTTQRAAVIAMVELATYDQFKQVRDVLYATHCGVAVLGCGAFLWSCRVVSCRVVSCRVVSCRVVSCRVVSCRVVSCRVVSCRVVSCRIVSCRIVSCRVASCCIVALAATVTREY